MSPSPTHKNKFTPGTVQYYPLDAEGYLVSLASRDKVQSPFHKLIDPVVSCYQKALGTALIGVYLRGSVATGTALKGISDFDAFALVSEEKLKKKVRWEDLELVEKERKQLEKKYSFVSQVEMAISTYKEADASLDPRVAIMMSSQSICLWGRDILPDLPRLRPGPELSRNLSWVYEVAPALKSYRKGKLSLLRLDSALKTLIRAAFERVMEREQSYTTDLYSCCLSFEKYYSSQAEALWMAREIFLQRGKAPDSYWQSVQALAEDREIWGESLNA